MTRVTIRSIALVGAGPRGASLVERIRVNARLRPGERLVITVIDPHEPGPGRVWRTDQHPDLVMNTYAGQATLFADSSVSCAGPVADDDTAIDLLRWTGLVRAHAQAERGGAVWADAAHLDPALTRSAAARAELDRTVAHSHPSRALFGHYLRWFFNRAIALMPDGIEVRVLADRVVDVVAAEADRQSLVLASGPTLEVDSVVFALGWLDARPSPADAELQWAAAGAGLSLIEPGNPVEQGTASLPAGQAVIVRGMGMGFFDLLSLVTIGRGGRFDAVAATIDQQPGAAELRYRASGREPVIHVGSRRGVPFRAKSIYHDVPPVTPQRSVRALEFAADRRDIDFGREIMPAVIRDATLAYYATLADTRPGRFAVDPERLLSVIRHRPAAEWPAAVRQAIPAAADRFDLDGLRLPGRGVKFSGPVDFARWLDSEIAADLDQATLGLGSAVKAATLSLGQARAAVVPHIAFGRLSPRSFAEDYRAFQSLGSMVASGPPAFRLAQLRALIAAGVVRPIGPGMLVTVENGRFVASSPRVPDSAVTARHLVDAWMHGDEVTRSREPLVATLLARGEIRAHALGGPGEDFRSGAIDVHPEDRRVLSADGQPVPRRRFIGIPTESAVFFTTICPIPHTNSAFLRESDAVARSVLIELGVGVVPGSALTPSTLPSPAAMPAPSPA